LIDCFGFDELLRRLYVIYCRRIAVVTVCQRSNILALKDAEMLHSEPLVLAEGDPIRISFPGAPGS